MSAGLGLALESVLEFHSLFGVMLAVVGFVAWYGGFGPAIVATGLEAFVADFLFIPPRFSLIRGKQEDVASLLVFCGSALTISVLFELQRRHQALAERNQDLAQTLLAKYEDEIAKRKRAQAAERFQSQKLSVTLSGMSDGVMATDAQGIVTYMNPAAELLTGVRLEEAAGQPVNSVAKLVDVETGNPLPSLIETFAQEGQHSLVILISKSGDTTPILGTVSPVRNDEGADDGLVLVLHNITELREVEAARVESEKRFETMADIAPVLIWVSGADKRFSWVNKAWIEFTGKILAEQVGEEWSSGLHPDDREECLQAYHMAFDAREPFGMEYRRRHHDGSYRWLLVHAVPRHDPSGVFRGYIGASLDITGRKENEEALRRSEEGLRKLATELEQLTAKLAKTNTELELQNRTIARANRQKTRFLTTMSHELRTPLNAITGFLELLAEGRAGSLNEKQKRYVQNIETGTEHLLRVVNDILDLSRIEAGKLDLDRQTFEITEAVNETIASMAPLAARKNLRLVVNVPGTETMYADRMRFQQILYNLLSNAIKFTHEGGQVSLDYSKNEESHTFTVSDTGIGIPLEEQRAIFDEFHQVESQTPGGWKGTGLGLAITRRLVECHSGTISVKSEPGKGSQFTFLFPTELIAETPRVESSDENIPVPAGPER